MIKSRWLKHLLAGLCLLMAIPAFAQEKYWIRVSDYSDLLTREIDTVSNLCKQNPTYGSYATGEHTYPGTLPMAGIRVQCSMENPNSTFKSFGMDVYCTKGFSHRSMVGIENGLEEGCYSQMTCEATREMVRNGEIDPPDECCTPLPLPPKNGNMCGLTPPIPVGGMVACDIANPTKREPCVWIVEKNPQANSIMNNAAYLHEVDHKNDSNLICMTSGVAKGYLGGNPLNGDNSLSELNAAIVELQSLEDNIKECCTKECQNIIQKRHDQIKDYCRGNANDYFSITKIDLRTKCERSIVK